MVSQWAQASGPLDRQFCFPPRRLPLIDQPLVAPTIFPEPLNVRKSIFQPGFALTWSNVGLGPISNRLEVSSSLMPAWITLAVLNSTAPNTAGLTYTAPIDAEWVCLRVRAEQQRFVSLWAMDSGPQDRQFCYRP